MYKVYLLNYDSEWALYCNAHTLFYAEEAKRDLERHCFQHHQIKITKNGKPID